MQISAKNQIEGKVTSVIHGTSYSQVAVEQTDADGNETGSFIHAAIPVDIFFLQQLLFLLSTTKLTSKKKFCGNSSQSI